MRGVVIMQLYIAQAELPMAGLPWLHVDPNEMQEYVKLLDFCVFMNALIQSIKIEHIGLVFMI